MKHTKNMSKKNRTFSDIKAKLHKHHIRTYVSLFSSAGIGCYGFKQNGYECIATCELLNERLNVQRANNKCRFDSGYICGDMTKDETKVRLFEEIQKWHEEFNIQDVDVVFATPPCQGMSTANCKKSDKEQVRNSLVVEAIRVIRDVNPKVFIFENVRSFMKTTCTDTTGVDMSIKDSIYSNLSENYYIYYKVLNFKDYGVPSSRPRTIVVGTRRDLRNISPLNIFPCKEREITLRESIGHLNPLGYAQRDAYDPFHFARLYDAYMEEWIAPLHEGQSAFENPDNLKPYKLDKNGNRITLKGAEMGNKFRRLRWDSPCSCIATRNDQLASNDTIHPKDNRVLSIRELMILMTIPQNFKWSVNDDKLTPESAEEYLSIHELNIRRCIGEAVPTHIIETLSKNVDTMLTFNEFVESFEEEFLEDYMQDEEIRNNFYIDTFLKEQAIANAKDTGSFYTPQCVVFDAVKDLDINKKDIRILEPSVGLGAFLPQLIALFSDKDSIIIDAVEIDADTIKSLQESIQKIRLGSNVNINYICSDFLEFPMTEHYDAVVTNPPYANSKKKYPAVSQGLKLKNLFGLFLNKIYDSADDIVCVIPKNFAMADEFEPIRNKYQTYPLVSICDFGVKFFKKVFVEILSLHFSKKYKGTLVVRDYVNNEIYFHSQNYIYHDHVWLLYRNEFFDKFIQTMQLDVFESFRDRQITNSMLSDKGRIRVLRSKNMLDDGAIINIDGYDKYIDDVSNLQVGKYLNKRSIIMVNFTYNTRATILPDNTVPNGSIAILTPKILIAPDDLTLYSSPEFRKYYEIVKSKSRFTLNIDECSLYYIGFKN